RATVQFNRLRDGGLTDEKLREIIVGDMDDIKSKLECLSLKDLDSSYSFLKKGVELLNLALNKTNKDCKASDDPADGTLNAALLLPQAIQRLKISSEERFMAAKDCFKASRETATHAFNNKSLSIKDRIMAAKLRVAARILESGFEDPESATTACKTAFKELHVFLDGGMKSKINKEERLENIMSVLFVNHILFDFASKYSSEYPNIFTWPGIKLTDPSDRKFHPILHAHEILTKTSSSEEFVQQLNRIVAYKEGLFNCSYRFALNSRNGIILFAGDMDMIIHSREEPLDVMFSEPLETKFAEHEQKALAVDMNDNVYVVRWVMKCSTNGYFMLYVFYETYLTKHVSILDFLGLADAGDSIFLNIAVDKNKNIFMIKTYDNQVYVSDSGGQLKYKFERDGNELRSLSISNTNDVIIP
ncbi:Hypothetical predicted protein, partial [Paramuricea clavata]